MPQLDTTTYFIQGISVLVIITIFFSLVWFGQLTYLYNFLNVPSLVFFLMRDFLFVRVTNSYSLYMIAGSLASLNQTVNTSSLIALRRPLIYTCW